MEIIVGIMLLMLFVQITVVIAGISKREDLFRFCYGYGIWAMIPINFLNLVAQLWN